MHPDYQWCIRRHDVRTTRDLLLEAIEFENIQKPPVVVVRKRDWAHRFCIDFRCVNEVTTLDAYPLLQITTTLDKI